MIVFRPQIAELLKYRLRRSGYGWSKMRFAAAQLLTYVEDDLWLRLARRANALASRLGSGLAATSVASLIAPVQANEVGSYPTTLRRHSGEAVSTCNLEMGALFGLSAALT